MRRSAQQWTASILTLILKLLLTYFTARVSQRHYQQVCVHTTSPADFQQKISCKVCKVFYGRACAT